VAAAHATPGARSSSSAQDHACTWATANRCRRRGMCHQQSAGSDTLGAELQWTREVGLDDQLTLVGAADQSLHTQW